MDCPSCGQGHDVAAQICDRCAEGSASAAAQEIAAGTLRDASTGFVGRQLEMDQLGKALEAAASGQGGLVMLMGEPGIGKTRTAQELSDHARLKGFQVMWGWCFEEAGAPPYWPWTQPLSLYIQGCDPAELQWRMGAGSADIAEIIPAVLEKLPGVESAQAVDPEQARFRLFESIATFLKRAAEPQPLLLVLDDLHWADKPSLLLLQFLTRQLGGTKLLILGCYRDIELSRRHPLSDTLARLAREPVFQRVHLQGLSQEDTGSFIEVVAGFRPSKSLAEGVHAQTEGNPFFVAELIRLLRAEGALASNVEAPSWSRVPQGVREVIGQRLSRLSGHCNQALSIASVIGREFEFNLLRSLNPGMTEEQLLDGIDEALGAFLIAEVPGVAERYQFSHSLVQQTLATELSTSRKVRLHARIAQALEDLYRDNVESHAAELAYHFSEAEAVLGTEKLAHYSLLAGDRALAAYAWENAAVHFQRGLDARGDQCDAQTAALLFGLGRSLQATMERHELHKVLETFRTAFDHAVKAGQNSLAINIAEHEVHSGIGYTGRVHLLEEALKLAPPGSLESGRLLMRYASYLNTEAKESEAALAALEESRDIAKTEGDGELEVSALNSLARIHYSHFLYRESLACALRAIELTEGGVGLPDAIVASLHWNAATAFQALGDLAQARRQATIALAIAEKLADRYALGRAIHIKRPASLHAGKLDGVPPGQRPGPGGRCQGRAPFASPGHSGAPGW